MSNFISGQLHPEISVELKVDMKRKFLFSHMKVHEKQELNAVDHFLISYLVPEISTFKGPKHNTQNWFTANNNNG